MDSIDFFVLQNNMLQNNMSQSTDHFFTIFDALEAVRRLRLCPPDTHPPKPVTIHIAPGRYYEKLTIAEPYVTLLGDHADTTILTFDDCARDVMADGSKRGTFRSYSVLIDTHDVVLRNLTIENSSFPRSRAGQAIALYADGDRLIIDHCHLLSYQDTLFTGPLPPCALSPGGFTGPKEFAPRINGRQYYYNCLICGDIDFIFGSATAYFDHCEIRSVHSEDLFADVTSGTAQTPVYGYITAASTAKDQTYGYVFWKCHLTSDCPDQSVYLGRPWRNFAKTVFLYCEMDSHIRPEGFHDWNKSEAQDTIYYGEYKSTGIGAHSKEKRAPYTHALASYDVPLYSPESVLSGTDGWQPEINCINFYI